MARSLRGACDPGALSVRANVVTVPALPSGGPNVLTSDLVVLLVGDAGEARWRLIDLYSRDLLPFEAHVEWAAGSGSGPIGRIVACRNARIALYARTVSIAVASLHLDPALTHRIGVLIADGYDRTRNQYEVRGTGNDGIQVAMIPPYAQRVRLEVGDLAQYGACSVRLLDAAAVPILRSDTRGDQQPGPGIPLGGANRCEVVVPLGLPYRVLYELGI